MDNYWCFMTSLLLLVAALTAQTRAGCSPEGFLYDSETRDEDLAAPQLVSTDTRRQSTCCPGKNNTCIAEGPRLNDLSSPSCFCDTSCIEIGDCCTDYAMACPVINCLLSDDWAAWTDCSASCGPGYKERTRSILVHPANGGQPCEANVEKMSCDGERCKVARAHQGFDVLKERARIVPAQFGSWRINKMYNPYQDIRKNLFEHYALDNTLDRPSYCAEFQVVDVHSSCQTSKVNTWSKRLKKGVTLCVECQSFSMKPELGGRCVGHGVYKKPTYWKAMTVPGCHGKWMMTSRNHEEGCRCDPEKEDSFVLV